MNSTLAGQVLTSLAEFSSQTRLYELRFTESDPRLLVEAFAADEQLLGVGARDVIALSTRANIAHSSLRGAYSSYLMLIASQLSLNALAGRLTAAGCEDFGGYGRPAAFLRLARLRTIGTLSFERAA